MVIFILYIQSNCHWVVTNITLIEEDMTTVTVLSNDVIDGHDNFRGINHSLLPTKNKVSYRYKPV